MQTFRQALQAKIVSIAELAGIPLYPGAIPETHDLGRDGPAMTWTVTTNPRNHHLLGSDGTSTATVQLSCWSYDLSDTDPMTVEIFNAIDGIYNDSSWGDGSVTIVSCLQVEETDVPEQVETGTDIWIHQIANEYSIKYRVAIPTHT